MIKINLLPTKKRAPKKITELQQQMILGALILGALFIGLWSYWKSLNNKINDLQKVKTVADARIKEQNKMLDEVKTVEAQRKTVNEKIAIIEELKKNQSRLVHLLDDLSRAVPTGVNLTTLVEDKGKIGIEGTAFTNNDVVRFIDNLKSSPHFADVFLQETVEGAESGINIYKYKLQFVLKGI